MCQHFLMLRSGNQLQLLLQHSLNSWRPILVVHINLYAYRYHCAISLMALCCPFSSTECLWKSQIRPLSLVLLFWIFWWICGSSVLNVLSCSLCCTLLFSILLYGPVFFSYELHAKGGLGASGRVLPPVTGRSRVWVAVSSHCTGEGKACRWHPSPDPHRAGALCTGYALFLFFVS